MNLPPRALRPGVSRPCLPALAAPVALRRRFTRTAVRAVAGVAGGALLAGGGLVAVAAPASAAVTRLSGADRYATAAAAALSGWDSAGTVVVASGSGGTDALAASSMAGSLDAPVLLTAADAAPAATLAALKELSPSFVVVLGGTSAVSKAAYEQLTEGTTATRVSGADRYATAAAVLAAFHSSLDPGTETPADPAPADPDAAFPAAADDGSSADGSGAAGASGPLVDVGSPGADAGPGRVAYLARGDVAATDVPADALAVSPVAWRTSTPVLLTARETLPAATAAAIRSGGVDRVVVLGGTGAVSERVAAAVRALGADVERVSGADRSATAAALAERAVAEEGFSTTQVGLASGRSVDALAAGPVAGRAGYPLLLTGSATDVGAATRAYLAARPAGDVVVIGGTTAVATTAVTGARR